MRYPRTFTAAVTVAVIVVAAVVFGFIFMYSGAYNVAADHPHLPVTVWVLSTTMEESVRHHATSVAVPSGFAQMDLREGFDHYREMCVVCHGAPGIERGEIGRGLNPHPPDLQEAAPEWTTAELYWIIRHGVKMTGMPSFGVTHTEQQLWAITAFVRHLPEMTPAEYESMSKSHGESTTRPADGE